MYTKKEKAVGPHVISNTTYVPKLGSYKKEWVIIDAEGKALGRLASQVAAILRGKHKPYYTPYLDCGDNVVVVNAAKLSVSGAKAEQKEYISYSGYPGGLKRRIYKDVVSKNGSEPLTVAVRGMLPKTKLGKQLLTNLRVYAGPEHQQQAQKPVPAVMTR